MALGRPTKRFREQFKAAPADVQDAVRDARTLIEGTPRETGRELRGHWRGVWSYTVGLYRIHYRIVGTRDQEVHYDSLLYRPHGYGRHPARQGRR